MSPHCHWSYFNWSAHAFFGFVYRTPCLCYFMCPLWVSSDSRKKSLTTFDVVLVQLNRHLFRLDFSIVDLVGNPSAACKYLTVFFVESSSYTLWIEYWGTGWSIKMVSVLSLSTLYLMVTRHNLLLSFHPCSTAYFSPLLKYLQRNGWSPLHYLDEIL